MSDATLKFFVSERYHSLQGESIYAGRKCLFLRLTGCDLRCSWCDSEFSFQGGTTLTLPQLVEWARMEQYASYPYLEVTGGEPLAQKGTPALLRELCNYKRVLLETGGHRSVADVDPRVYVILDVKCPSSGEHEKMCWDNFDILREAAKYDTYPDLIGGAELKFVIQDARDFNYAVDVIAEHHLDSDFLLTFSPSFGRMLPGLLADWIVNSGLSNARLQIQQHKLLWRGKADFGLEGVPGYVTSVDFLSGKHHVL